MNIKDKYRYPGPIYFSREEEKVFFGRDNDIKDLSQFIIRHKQVVLYSKSGVGKSSILQAGIIPFLESETPEYICYYIRMDPWKGNIEEDPLESLVNALPSSSSNYLNNLYELDFSLWKKFKRRQFELDGKANFILVLDQFEELFYYPGDHIQSFCKELCELIYNELPLRYQYALEAFPDKLSEKEKSLIYQPLNIRVLFSIRSEKLSELDQLSNYLPNIFQNRYQLNHLNRTQALEAIIRPVSLEGDEFLFPPFGYTKEALDHILDYLSSNSAEPIESFQLQMICQHIERQLIRNRPLRAISKDELRDLPSISEAYYQYQIDSLEAEIDREKARRLIEEGLIFEDEKRRITLYEGQIIQDFNVPKELINELVNKLLIRRIPDSKGGFSFEISHDTLVGPILDNKQKREINNREKQIKEKELLINEREENIKLREESLEKNYFELFSKYLQSIQRSLFNNITSIFLFSCVYLWYFYFHPNSIAVLSQDNDLQILLFIASHLILSLLNLVFYKISNSKITDGNDFDASINYSISLSISILIYFSVPVGFFVSVSSGFPSESLGLPNPLLLFAFLGITILIHRFILIKVFEKLIYIKFKLYYFILFLGFIILYALIGNKGDVYESIGINLMFLILGIFFYSLISYNRFKKKKYSTDKVYLNSPDIFVLVAAIFLGLLFLLFNINPTLGIGFNPLTCVNTALIFYSIILYSIKLASKNWKIDIAFLGIILFFSFEFLNFPPGRDKIHTIDTIDNSFNLNKRLDNAHYFEEWIQERRENIIRYYREKEMPYPIFIVASQLGGSRAGYWTLKTHLAFEKFNPNYYENHLFAMTGAGDGLFGHSLYFSLKEAKVPVDEILNVGRNVFRQNYLSPLLIQLWGRDQWKKMIGINGEDRASFFTKQRLNSVFSSAGNFSVKIRDTFEKPFLSSWYELKGIDELEIIKPAPPLLIINSSSLLGFPGFISPVYFNPKDAYAYDIPLIISKSDFSYNQSLSLNSAISLNGRSPFIDPVAQIPYLGVFGGAEYYDPTGIDPAISLIKSLRKHIASAPDTSIANIIQINLVLIRNYTFEGLDSEIIFYEAPSVSQFLAPYIMRENHLYNQRAFRYHQALNELFFESDGRFEINLLPRRENKISIGNDTIISHYS